MKKIFSAILITMLIQTGFSRQVKDSTAIKKENYKTHRFSIGGSVGYGWPTGEYRTGLIYYQSSGPPEYSYVGWAEPGFHFDVNFSCQTSKDWGILFETAGNDNPYISKHFLSGSYHYLGEYSAGPFYCKAFNTHNILEAWLVVGVINLQNSWSNIMEWGEGAELGIKYKKRILNPLYLTLSIAYLQAQQLSSEKSSEIFYAGPIGLITGGLGLEFEF